MYFSGAWKRLHGCHAWLLSRSLHRGIAHIVRSYPPRRCITTCAGNVPKKAPVTGAFFPQNTLPYQPAKAFWHQASSGAQVKPKTSSARALIDSTQRAGASARARTSVPSRGASKYITFTTRR